MPGKGQRKRQKEKEIKRDKRTPKKQTKEEKGAKTAQKNHGGKPGRPIGRTEMVDGANWRARERPWTQAPLPGRKNEKKKARDTSADR